MSDQPAELFDLFWENSKFTEATIGAFQKRIENYSGNDKQIAALQYPAADIPLVRPAGKLQKSLAHRLSIRKFSNKPITTKQLGTILGGLMARSTDSRLYPSAGATFATETFCIINRSKGDLSRKVCYYNCDNHSLSVVSSAPVWDDYNSALNLDTSGTIPAVIFIFVLFPSRVTSKYGERGGRFALIEVGHMAQNLALGICDAGLGSVEMGGLLDDTIKQIIGLEHTDARIALGVACGELAKSN